MSGTNFSGLIPSVLRLIGGEKSGCVHLAAQEAAPIAEWGGCFRSEEDVDRILQILEPLLVLLSLAGYGVPEVVLSAQGVPQPDRISVSMPSLEIRRGTARSWDANSSARVGLRVCPTGTNSLDLGTELAAFKPGFGPKVCGWLLLPVSEADPRTSLDDSVQKLWLPLSKKVAAASAGTGVTALIDKARTYSPTKQLGMLAALPGLVDKASIALQSLGAAAMLEAEFVADRLGKKLSEQMQELRALSDGASSLLARVESKGLVATTTEAFWGWWHDDETEEEPQDAPSLRAVEALGWIRALLSFVGTTQVQDTGAGTQEPMPELTSTPLANLRTYREVPAEARKANWDQLLPFVKKGSDGTVGVTIPEYKYTRDPSWGSFKNKTDPYPLFSQPQASTPIHTLDFARCWFDLGDEGTTYVRLDPEILAYIDDKVNRDFKTLVDSIRYKKEGETATDIDRGRIGAFKLLLARGEPTLKACWCSGFTLLTLGAAGYDLEAPLTGKNGVPHGYVDKRRWTAIRPYMLIDGQPEATAAMGAILKECKDGDPKAANGLALDLPDSLLGAVRDYGDVKESERRLPKAGEPAKGILVKDQIPIFLNKIGAPCGYRDKSLYEEYGKETVPQRDYLDSTAVRMAPGAIELMKVGVRVNFDHIRPGDIGQRVDSETIDEQTVYEGKGHAFQVWAIQARGHPVPNAPHPPRMVDGSAPDAEGRVLFEIDKDTPATKPLDDSLMVCAYRLIEANFQGATQGLADAKGGVSISAWIPFPPKEKSPCFRRYYFARLHESPWSVANLAAKSAAAPKGAAAVPPSAPPQRRQKPRSPTRWGGLR